MDSKIRSLGDFLLVLGVTVGIIITGCLFDIAYAKDSFPNGRTPVRIVDSQYPASYFPNTELLGPDEMRITALGTGMPNQTKAAASMDEYVPPPDVTKAYIVAPRTEQKHPSKYIWEGKWKDYTPPPMPKN